MQVPNLNASQVDGKSASGLTRAAFGDTTSTFTLTGSYQPYGQVTINAPAAGYVVVNSAVTVGGPSCANGCVAEGFLQNQTTGISNVGSNSATAVPAGTFSDLSDTDVFPVQAGSNTIVYQISSATSGSGTTVQAISSHMSALYTPYDGNGNTPSAAAMSAKSNQSVQRPNALSQLSKQ